MKLIAAIDGGGSKTSAVIAGIDGKIVGRGLAGSSNASRVGEADAIHAVKAALQAALHDAGYADAQLELAVIGIAGTTPGLREALSMVASRVVHSTDVELLLAMCPEDEGISLVAGTGSSCAYQSGKELRVIGGRGPLFDEGGATWLALRALEALAKIEDGRYLGVGAEEFRQIMFKELNISEFRALYASLYREGIKVQADLLSKVSHTLTAMKNEIADNILQAGAVELAAHVKAALTRSGLQRPVLAVGGSLLVEVPSYSAFVAETVRGSVREIITVREPVLAGAQLAIRLL